MAALWYALCAVLLLDSLRVRKLWKAVPRLAPSTTPVAADHRFFTAPGVELDDDTRRAASAFLEGEEIDVLDLAPADLPALRALAAAQFLNRAELRGDRLARGRTVGYALVTRAELLERARIAAEPPADAAGFARLAARLKRYAARGADIAIAPQLRATKRDPFAQRAALTEMLGQRTSAVLVISLLFVALLLAGFAFSPLAAAAALAAYHLQPAIALAGGPLRSRSLWSAILLRTPLAVIGPLRLLLSDRQSDREQVEALRPVYAELLADGVEPFFSPRRETCPICGSGRLKLRLRNRDLLQGKPGAFSLERCEDCGHVFQNPQLSIRGLEFYYRDFYDGLGQRSAEHFFGLAVRTHPSQIESLRQVAEPKRWLDVGTGHGHFCCVARRFLPETSFEGLDISVSIEEAERSGWIEKGYRGLFPDLAPSLENRFDAVSMFHYLEHTLDPRAEIEAARTALAPGGHLLIEVPNPEYVGSRVLGRFWLQWFQPQHLHLLSLDNLNRLLREAGFEPVVNQRVEAHRPQDFLSAIAFFTNWAAPEPDVPWRPRPSLVKRIWVKLVRALTLPFPLLGYVADCLLQPFLRQAKQSNGFRVAAKNLKPQPVPVEVQPPAEMTGVSS